MCIQIHRKYFAFEDEISVYCNSKKEILKKKYFHKLYEPILFKIDECSMLNESLNVYIIYIFCFSEVLPKKITMAEYYKLVGKESSEDGEDNDNSSQTSHSSSSSVSSDN